MYVLTESMVDTVSDYGHLHLNAPLGQPEWLEESKSSRAYENASLKRKIYRS